MIVLPTIWIVDAANGPGTSFVDLPPAVAAAASGDTIIVRAGGFSAFSVSGKSLTIRGAGAAIANVHGVGGGGPVPASGTTIAAVPAGSTFYVSGLTFAGASYPGGPTPASPGLSAPGASRIVDDGCDHHGRPSRPATPPPGFFFSGGAEVHVSRTTISGGSAAQ